jgi:hypothetical protein
VVGLVRDVDRERVGRLWGKGVRHNHELKHHQHDDHTTHGKNRAQYQPRKHDLTQHATQQQHRHHRTGRQHHHHHQREKQYHREHNTNDEHHRHHTGHTHHHRHHQRANKTHDDQLEPLHQHDQLSTLRLDQHQFLIARVDVVVGLDVVIVERVGL